MLLTIPCVCPASFPCFRLPSVSSPPRPPRSRRPRSRRTRTPERPCQRSRRRRRRRPQTRLWRRPRRPRSSWHGKLKVLFSQCTFCVSFFLRRKITLISRNNFGFFSLFLSCASPSVALRSLNERGKEEEEKEKRPFSLLFLPLPREPFSPFFLPLGQTDRGGIQQPKRCKKVNKLKFSSCTHHERKCEKQRANLQSPSFFSLPSLPERAPSPRLLLLLHSRHRKWRGGGGGKGLLGTRGEGGKGGGKAALRLGGGMAPSLLCRRRPPAACRGLWLLLLQRRQTSPCKEGG